MNNDLSILLVDDDEVGLKVLGKILKQAGYEVEMCTSSTMAWELFQQKKFHIAILDIMMPDMDGIELLQNMKKHDALSQIFLITAANSISKAIHALEYGAVDCLLKPVDKEQLLNAVKECEAKVMRWRQLIKSMAKRSKNDI